MRATPDWTTTAPQLSRRVGACLEGRQSPALNSRSNSLRRDRSARDSGRHGIMPNRRSLVGCSNVVAGSKKHHYTPNFILRHFADDASKTLWVWDKEMHECRAVRGGPKERYNAFLENHYNTIFDEGKPDRSIEQHLASVERGAGPVIGKIVDTARTGLLPVLSPGEKERLCRFLWIQHLRSPHTRAGMVNNEESRQVAFDSIRQAAKGSDLPESEVRRLMEDVESLVEGAAKKIATMQYSRGCTPDLWRAIRFGTLDAPNSRRSGC